METIVAAVVFGLIGIAVVGALIYILGMLLSGPVILADQLLQKLHHEGAPNRGTHHHHHRLVLHG